ncbi:MAG: hypothetical protein JW953_23480 [Anaerolineae bacterium]|nr:hypothetical protein [Anaerolineae bacterium]
MAGSRPSIQSVQRSLIIGVLAGLIFGCIAGLVFSYLYIRLDPPVYQGGAYPEELAPGYQSHYLAMVVDSYIVNHDEKEAQRRLQTFDQATKIRVLGERFTVYVANGQAVEAQAVSDLAGQLKNLEGWSAETISAEVGKLAAEYQGDSAKMQAVTSYGAALNVVQQVTPPPAGEEPVTPIAPATTAPPAEEPGGLIAGFSAWQLGLCCLSLLLIIVVVLLIGRWQFNRSRRAPARPQIEWEGEGPAPIKQWSGTYTLGQDNYDEFFTIETLEGDFLGESGMGILEAIPGTSPKQVVAFDVGLFDKTDITTLSRVVMSEHAFYDEAIQAKVEANPQAEAVLAQPGAEFVLETSALRVVAHIDELEYGEGNVYFNRLTVTLTVFIKEGVDLRIGTMDVPEEYQ